MIAYKLLRPGRVAPFSGVAWPAPGQWVDAEDVEPCRSGLHACHAGDLPYWLGLGELWEVELEDVEAEDRKLAARRGRLLRRVEQWNEDAKRAFIESCAERTRPIAAQEPQLAAFLRDVEGASSPQSAGFIAARVAELHGGPAAYEEERRAQAEWLIDALALARA